MNVDPPEEVLDRRVRRTRSALLAAAVRLVTERGTTDLSVTELTEAADVSRRVLYQHFGDRDGLLTAAAAELAARELLPLLPADLDVETTILLVARHLAAHRTFYRALVTGSCSYDMSRTVSDLMRPFSTASVRQALGGDLDDATAVEIADFFTGASVTALHRWLVEGPDPLRPEEFAERMLRIQAILTDARGRQPDPR